MIIFEIIPHLRQEGGFEFQLSQRIAVSLRALPPVCSVGYIYIYIHIYIKRGEKIIMENPFSFFPHSPPLDHPRRATTTPPRVSPPAGGRDDRVPEPLVRRRRRKRRCRRRRSPSRRFGRRRRATMTTSLTTAGFGGDGGGDDSRHDGTGRGPRPSRSRGSRRGRRGGTTSLVVLLRMLLPPGRRGRSLRRRRRRRRRAGVSRRGRCGQSSSSSTTTARTRMPTIGGGSACVRMCPHVSAFLRMSASCPHRVRIRSALCPHFVRNFFTINQSRGIPLLTYVYLNTCFVGSVLACSHKNRK